MTGYIHSLQTLGAVDGPGIRYVIFMQGCPLRCMYCHNPDTWELYKKDGKSPENAVLGDAGDADGCRVGTPCTSDALIEKILRYRPYFGAEGGVTVSGGEPLFQAEFVTELFTKLHGLGIKTCLDTSGNFKGGRVTEEERAEWDALKRGEGKLMYLRSLLKVTDLVICDIKFTDEEQYNSYTGGSLERVERFLKLVEEEKVDLWVRHVVVPGYTDSDEEHEAMARLAKNCKTLKRIELLPFKKLCLSKYESLGIPFPLKDVPEAPSPLVTLYKS